MRKYLLISRKAKTADANPRMKRMEINLAKQGNKAKQKTTNINLWFFILIILVGVILRFYRLGEVPRGFHRDEAFLGYNGYSILQTGKDMSGNRLPLHLESFIYSPAGYSYFSIPFIKIFGLNEFSTRAASAFFGTLTVLVTYFF